MKKNNFNRFAWRDDVFADTDVPAAPKCLAFGIAQFINCETGEAIVGTRKLAKACGFSQAWVRKQVPLLAATGWMQVKAGRRGSGPDCTSSYKMNPKREHTGCSHLDDDREHFLPLREHTGCSEPLNHIGAASPRTAVPVDREKVIHLKPARVFDALIDTYPVDFKDNSESLAKKIFHTLCSQGFDPNEIIAAAESYSNKISETGGDVMFLADWLKGNFHLNASCYK